PHLTFSTFTREAFLKFSPTYSRTASRLEASTPFPSLANCTPTARGARRPPLDSCPPLRCATTEGSAADGHSDEAKEAMGVKSRAQDRTCFKRLSRLRAVGSDVFYHKPTSECAIIWSKIHTF